MVTRNGVGRINAPVKLLDEAQYEVKHGLIKYKSFKQDEQAMKDFIASTKDTWYPLHTDKGWFAASSIVTSLCREAVEKAAAYYKLNVQLGIDPQFGIDWASCH